MSLFPTKTTYFYFFTSFNLFSHKHHINNLHKFDASIYHIKINIELWMIN